MSNIIVYRLLGGQARNKSIHKHKGLAVHMTPGPHRSPRHMKKCKQRGVFCKRKELIKEPKASIFLKKNGYALARRRRGSAQRSPSVVPFLTGGERNEILTLVPEADERGLARTGPLYRVRGSVQESTGGGLSHASARDCMQNHAGQVSRTVPGERLLFVL
jgi:hypothetical protein